MATMTQSYANPKVLAPGFKGNVAQVFKKVLSKPTAGVAPKKGGGKKVRKQAAKKLTK